MTTEAPLDELEMIVARVQEVVEVRQAHRGAEVPHQRALLPRVAISH